MQELAFDSEERAGVIPPYFDELVKSIYRELSKNQISNEEQYIQFPLTTGPPSRSLWRLPQVKTATGLGRSSIYAKMKAGTFPKAINIEGGPMVAWDSCAVQAWIEEQIKNSRKAS